MQAAQLNNGRYGCSLCGEVIHDNHWMGSPNLGVQQRYSLGDYMVCKKCFEKECREDALTKQQGGK